MVGGRRQHHHALIPGEPVHLGEDLVEGLLLLITAPTMRGPRPADGVQLVDEDDRRGYLLGLVEQVRRPAGAHADDHLDELRGGDREERHVRLARHCRASRVLPVPGWPESSTPCGICARQPAVAARVPQEVHDLGDLVLDLIDACHIGEGGRLPRARVVAEGPGPAHATQGALATAPPEPPAARRAAARARARAAAAPTAGHPGRWSARCSPSPRVPAAAGRDGCWRRSAAPW